MATRPAEDLRIVLFGEAHDRGSFTCGVESLHRYLKTQARQDVRRKASAVFVLSEVSEPTHVLGYYTLCAMAISQGEVPEAACTHVPRYPLVSATLISRLAVAKERQGQRLGAVLLADASRRAFDIAGTVGSSMVVVDSLGEGATVFYAAHGCAAARLAPAGSANARGDRELSAVMVTQPNLIGMTVPGGSEALSAMRPLGWNITPTEPAGRAARHEMAGSPVPNAAGRIPRHDAGCFPGTGPMGGEAKNGPEGPL